ncbi:sodium-dependent transporter [Paenibacillus thailandensis]|uniref:Transporter n=1 Tax=Paenibacillus thailandensis TaxID=393250 RepID=A0ABW5R3W9_9BACL
MNNRHHEPAKQDQASSGDNFSRGGFILAAIGSAVGLGNLWKFPYITGMYGGAAFFLLFIICLLLVGLPILLGELVIGRGGRGSAASSLVRLSGKKAWGGFGVISIAGSFFILSFYGVVAGWAMHYMILSFSGELFSNSDFAGQFAGFNASWLPVLWQFVAMFLTAFVIYKGVSSGIEKFNKIFLPALVVLLVLLMIRALTMDGAAEGVSFFLRPDFSKLTGESVLVALGHAFFSLSLGMGTMITYGAYVDKRQSLGTATLAIGGGDLLYALMAGLIIFPITFSFGIEPGQGPSLVFIALPAAFEAMPAGWLFGGLFFMMLTFAALTSTVSLLEVPVAYIQEKLGWGRKLTTVVVGTLCFLIGVPSALSIGQYDWLTFGGKAFFDWMDFIASNIILPVGGFIVTIFVGYVWQQAGEEAGLTAAWFKLWIFMVRYVAPVLVLAVFLYTSGLLELFY